MVHGISTNAYHYTVLLYPRNVPAWNVSGNRVVIKQGMRNEEMRK